MSKEQFISHLKLLTDEEIEMFLDFLQKIKAEK